MKEPFTIYTPTKTDGGDGTYSETLTGGSTIYGMVDVDQSETEMIVDSGVSVSVEDIIVINSQQYRVLGFRQVGRAPQVILRLEKVEKPLSVTDL